MQIESSNHLVSNAYHVQVGLAETENALSPVERQAIAQFGEPIVECGSSFSGSYPFTLPSNQLSFPSQFPVKQVFQIPGNVNANSQAEDFRSEIKARIQTAMTTIVSASVGTTGDWSEPIST